MTSRVSTRTSRSPGSPTRVFADGAAGRALGFDSGDGTAGDAGDAGGPAGVPATDAGAEAPIGFGTGFTNSACQTYRTRNARKMERRTRRSINGPLGQERGRALPHKTDGNAPADGPRASCPRRRRAA